MRGKIVSLVLIGLMVAMVVLVGCAAPAATPTPTPTPTATPKPTATPTPTPTAAVQVVRWKVDCTMPQGSAGVGESIVWFKDEVEKRTNRGLILDCYWGGSLGYKAPQALQELDKRLVDMVQIPGADVVGEEPALGILALPGLVPGDMGLRVKMWDDLLPNYSHFIESKYDVSVYGMYQAPARNLYLKAPAKNLAEIKGKKIRAMSTDETKLTAAMAAVGTPIGATDVYSALQSGIIDGGWMQDSAWYSFRLHEQSKYIIDIGIDGGPSFVSFNKKSLDSLPPEYKKTLMDIQPAYQAKLAEFYLAADKAGRQQLLDGGMQVTPWPAADVQKVFQLAGPIRDEWYKTHGVAEQAIFNRVQTLIAELQKPTTATPTPTQK